MLKHIFYCAQMSVRKVADVDIVPHARAVGGIIIVTENAQPFKLADCYLTDVRQKIVRNTVGVLADKSRRVRADRVEIAQQRDRPLVVGGVNVFEYLLDHQLGVAVGIGRAGGHILNVRYGIYRSVDCCGG